MAQLPAPVPPATVPLKIAVGDEEHNEGVTATDTVGCRTIGTLRVFDTAGQGPLLEEVSVKLTEPALMSPGVTPYNPVAPGPGVMAPDPPALQVPVPETPRTVPVSDIDGCVEQMEGPGPGRTVAMRTTVTCVVCA